MRQTRQIVAPWRLSPDSRVRRLSAEGLYRTGDVRMG